VFTLRLGVSAWYTVNTSVIYLSQYLTNKICFTISFISCLYMFRAHVLIIRRSKLHYTATGIITPIGGCVMQFWPDDEHMCSKHVEEWNKTYCKTKILCIKLVKYWDKYTEMHCQENVKISNIFVAVYTGWLFMYFPQAWLFSRCVWAYTYTRFCVQFFFVSTWCRRVLLYTSLTK